VMLWLLWVGTAQLIGGKVVRQWLNIWNGPTNWLIFISLKFKFTEVEDHFFPPTRQEEEKKKNLVGTAPPPPQKPMEANKTTPAGAAAVPNELCHVVVQPSTTHALRGVVNQLQVLFSVITGLFLPSSLSLSLSLSSDPYLSFLLP